MLTRLRVAAAGVAAALLLGSGFVLAGSVGIPTDGVFWACYDGGGNVKLIDHSQTQTCPKGLNGPVSWNQVGPAGQDGAPGAPGAAGVAGKDGVGVAAATVNASGHLILAFTDGTTHDAGLVTGGGGGLGSFDALDGLPCNVGQAIEGTITIDYGQRKPSAIYCLANERHTFTVTVSGSSVASVGTYLGLPPFSAVTCTQAAPCSLPYPLGTEAGFSGYQNGADWADPVVTVDGVVQPGACTMGFCNLQVLMDADHAVNFAFGG